ncbi:MAG TPA: hypothetical protein VHG91_01625 [Longimicrobium sp.]|nr:hypothetical protein [Longimicrobium sp.]
MRGEPRHAIVWIVVLIGITVGAIVLLVRLHSTVLSVARGGTRTTVPVVDSARTKAAPRDSADTGF